MYALHLYNATCQIHPIKINRRISKKNERKKETSFLFQPFIPFVSIFLAILEYDFVLKQGPRNLPFAHGKCSTIVSQADIQMQAWA